MSKRLFSSLLCAAVFLALLPAASVPAVAAGEELLYSFPFDSESSQGAFFTTGGAVSVGWTARAGAGHGDDTALIVTHTDGATYNSAENAVRLTLPEPLPAGGVYRIAAWVYAASDENPGKGTLTGPGFVLNGDYAGNQGVVKFPQNFGTLPADEWKGIDVTLPMQETPVSTLDFRIVINEADKHPDVWYWDNIEIYRVGDLVSVTAPEWDLALPSLHEAYRDCFLLGNILEPNQLTDRETADMFGRYYNAMTAGNAMKPASLTQEKGVYGFSGADLLVDWALENGIAVHGHCLVWHDQSPDWLNKNAGGSPLTRAEARKNLEDYIDTVAGHFKGKVISWDVVNEALLPNPSSSAWREGLRTDAPWYRAYANGADRDAGESGGDYIYDAFVFARLADPEAVLYYLDYNEEYTEKRGAMAYLAEDLNEKWKTDPRNTQPDRPLVEGLGLQAHYWTDMLKPADVEETILRFIRTGVRLSISELDIPFGTYGNFQQRAEPPTEEELERQAGLYRELLTLFVKYADAIDRVTFWGLADSQSWRGAGYPLLFDKYFSPKPSFWSVLGVIDPSAAADLPGTVTDGDLGEEPAEPFPPSEVSPSPVPAEPSAPAEPAESGSGFPTGLVIAIIAAALLVAGAVLFRIVGKRNDV